MKIAITGGKGGVGKTTITIFLAKKYLKEGKRVLLCDCDVECPNLHILLKEKLKKPFKKIFAFFPRLNKKKCKKCDICKNVCKENAIFKPKNSFPVFLHDLCSACGACMIVCPHKAIEKEKKEIGEIFLKKIQKNFWLITGKAHLGVEETGPVVLETKKTAERILKENKFDVLLIDTAPGIHCPVISALVGCDLVYCVAEPSPMSSKDLELILKLCKKLKLKSKVILNLSDLGKKEMIKKTLLEFKMKIEKEVPFSEKIQKAYSEGNLLKCDFAL